MNDRRGWFVVFFSICLRQSLSSTTSVTALLSHLNQSMSVCLVFCLFVYLPVSLHPSNIGLTFSLCWLPFRKSDKFSQYFTFLHKTNDGRERQFFSLSTCQPHLLPSFLHSLWQCSPISKVSAYILYLSLSFLSLHRSTKKPILSFHVLNPALWPHIGLLSLSLYAHPLFSWAQLCSTTAPKFALFLCAIPLLLASALHSDRTGICLRLHGVISSLWMSCKFSSPVLLLSFCFFYLAPFMFTTRCFRLQQRFFVPCF